MIPKLVVTAVLMAAQMALGATRKIEGPRLDNRKVTTADYGTPLVRAFWGICRFVGCPNTWSEDLREKKKKSKTKGGKYTEYKYFWTGESHVADCVADAVTRIWFDNHIVYQVTGAGAVSQFLQSQFNGDAIKVDARNIAIYLGDDTQDPDPRQEAWFEDEFGAGSCSAHRGTTRVVFKDIPVEKFGNRPPTVDIEAIRTKATAFIYETLTSANSTGAFTFNGGWGVRWSTFGRLEWYDTANRIVLGTSPSPGVFTGTVNAVALDVDGTAYCYGASDASHLYLIVTSPLGVPTKVQVPDGASVSIDNVRVFTQVAYGAYSDSAGYLKNAAHAEHTLRARDFCKDNQGGIWGLFQPDGSSDEFTIEQIDQVVTPTSWTFSGAVTRGDVTDCRFCFTEAGYFFVDGDDGNFYIIDPADGSIVDSGTAGWSDAVQLPAQFPGRSVFWDRVDKYSLLNGSLLLNQDYFDWVSSNISDWAYDPLTHAIWAGQPASTNVVVRYLDRVSADGVTLGEVIDEVSNWVGVNPDVTALTQPIAGYSVTPGTAREMMEPLLDIHDSLCRTHDFSIQFIKHATTSQGTIDVSTFVREGDDPAYTIDEETGLPREIVVTYADKGKDHQVNTVTARRVQEAVDTEKSQAINLETYAGTPDDIQQLADRWLRAKWNRRHLPKNAITAKYLAAECGDVYDLRFEDGIIWTAELEKMTFAATSPKITCEWRRTFPSINTLGSGTGPPMLGDDEDEIIIPAPTKAFFLDIPFTSDVEAEPNPLIHYGAGSYGSGAFPGAAMYEGDLDGEDFTEFAAIPSDEKAIWGYATTTLATANPNLWDRGNTLTVRVFGGTLDTVTEAEINADPTINMFALKSGDEWELGNFTTATLTATTTAYREYDISGFLRGRRGTEWAVDDHADGDDFVLVSHLFTEQQGLSEVGNSLTFKGQSYGRDPELASAQIIEFEGQSLKPYAPARIKWSTDGTDMFGEIIRRTRVGGAWTGGAAIPLSENSEEYEVDIMDGDDVLRTITVSGTNTFTYTDAMMTEDGNTVADPPSYNAYQISDAVGRGFALAA